VGGRCLRGLYRKKREGSPVNEIENLPLFSMAMKSFCYHWAKTPTHACVYLEPGQSARSTLVDAWRGTIGLIMAASGSNKLISVRGRHARPETTSWGGMYQTSPTSSALYRSRTDKAYTSNYPCTISFFEIQPFDMLKALARPINSYRLVARVEMMLVCHTICPYRSLFLFCAFLYSNKYLGYP
jgi:hypothetical protein